MAAGDDFRIVYSGVGNQLNALVYNLADLSTPLGAFSVDASNYDPQPTPTPYTSGSVGLIVAQADGPTDPHTAGAPYAATFDNFKVTVPTGVEWNALGGGLASDKSNWVGNAPPDGVGTQARFLGGAETDAEVNIDTSFYTLGKVTFDNTHAYKLSGLPLLIQDAGNAEIAVLSGSHEIAADLALGSNLRITGSGTLTISGPIDWSGKSIEVAGAHLRLANTSQGTLNISSGSASLVPGSGASVLNSLTIAGGGTPTAKFDVTNSAAVLDYTETSPAGTVRQQILAGRGGSGLGKPWNGNGITSSTAQADVVTSPNSTSVGYAENSALPLGAYTNFRGKAVDLTAVLVAYTRTADANLDGIVNDNDVTIVGANYAPGIPKPAWALGDFDYNGFVDDNDVTLLGVFYNPNAQPLGALPPEAQSSSVSAVPEPTTLFLATLSALSGAVLARRWRWMSGGR